MQAIEGVIQHYAWGDRAFIPEMLGIEPDGEPWAELWLGTHPNGPAVLADGTPLADIAGELPYLLKVLACGEPLSLQTHPNPEQARDGHARGIYPDPNPKPELLCALTPFEALCGVRPVEATLALLDEVGVVDLRRVLAAAGPGPALTGLFRGDLDPQPVIDVCASSSRPEAAWIRRLASRYPGERSVAVALLLNLVVLEPGQALRLDAGNLHSYLAGAGIELMGPSDNVVRGGLTVKAVDVDELLRVLDPRPLDHPVLPMSTTYELPAAGVALHRLDAGAGHAARGHELTVDVSGRSGYLAPGERFTAERTTFVVVPLGG